MRSRISMKSGIVAADQFRMRNGESHCRATSRFWRCRIVSGVIVAASIMVLVGFVLRSREVRQFYWMMAGWLWP